MQAPHPTAGAGPDDSLQLGLIQAAHWIWERRETAKAAGFPFSEETVTETVLLDLATAFPGQLKIVPFNKPAEGKTGADWEWCLYDLASGRFLRFLIQAKVLDDKDRAYAHIDREIGNTGVRQIDRLADTSRARGVPALYAFYNHLTDVSRLQLDACDCFNCAGCWGASVAPLHAVRALLPDKTFDALVNVSVPWACLLCAETVDPPGPSDDLIEYALSAMWRLFERCDGKFEGDEMDWPTPPTVPERQPPDYLLPLLDAGHDPAGRAKLQQKLSAENPGVDGVVLVPANLKPPESD